MVGGDLAGVLVGHYVKALEIRRKAHQMGAIFGAKLPCSPTFVPGGCTEAVTSGKISDFRALLTEAEQICDFIDTVYIPDVEALAGLFPQYLQIGRGCGNLLAYGVFDLDGSDNNRLLARGRYTDAVLQNVNVADITEDVLHSWYISPSGLNPASGQTEPDAAKPGAYSWIKAPRYSGQVHEVGPLARMWVNGDLSQRHFGHRSTRRTCMGNQEVADAMVGWLNELIRRRLDIQL